MKKTEIPIPTSAKLLVEAANKAIAERNSEGFAFRDAVFSPEKNILTLFYYPKKKNVGIQHLEVFEAEDQGHLKARTTRYVSKLSGKSVYAKKVRVSPTKKGRNCWRAVILHEN